jgi:Na+/alanine symporter
MISLRQCMIFLIISILCTIGLSFVVIDGIYGDINLIKFFLNICVPIMANCFIFLIIAIIMIKE